MILHAYVCLYVFWPLLLLSAVDTIPVSCAAWYITRLLVTLTPKGLVFSFLSSCECACMIRCLNVDIWSSGAQCTAVVMDVPVNSMCEDNVAYILVKERTTKVSANIVSKHSCFCCSFQHLEKGLSWGVVP